MLTTGENYCFNFKAAKKGTEKKIVIRDLQEDLPTSSPFFVEDIAEFQIPYKCAVGNYEDSLWHDPSERNNFNRCVQVSIVSQDDATIFIFFQAPQMPEYSINNTTMDMITIRMKGKAE